MLEIKIDLDKKCERCGEDGALSSGICMACLAKGIKKGEFDYIIKKAKENIFKK